MSVVWTIATATALLGGMYLTYRYHHTKEAAIRHQCPRITPPHADEEIADHYILNARKQLDDEDESFTRDQIIAFILMQERYAHRKRQVV